MSMDERLVAIAGMHRVHDDLFRGALAKADGDAWLARHGEANHVGFLATHLVGARHFIIRFAGGESTDPLEPYHQGKRSIDEMTRFPSPEETLVAWIESGPILQAALAAIDPSTLDEDSGVPFPAPGPTRLDAFTFLAQHEAYHLGQMGLLRRIAGLPAAEWT